MVSKAFEKEILRNLSLLEKDQLNKVLDYIKSLTKVSKKSGPDILKFAGSIDKPELKLMSEAIEADCENVDNNEW